MKVLYISYDGLLEPLGQSQVLSYQEKLAKEYDIHILSFEKRDDLKDKHSLNDLNIRILEASINWHYLKYHKRFSIFATAYDVLRGFIVSFWICYKYKIQIVHARSYVPSLIAIYLKKLIKVKFIFDMRGFWADEKVDGGEWSRESSIYKLTKSFEKKFLLGADHIVSLTHAGIAQILKFDYIKNKDLQFSVIPTCADLSLFKKMSIQKDILTIGYVGSAGLWYNFPATLKAFSYLLALEPRTKFLIINRNEHDFIKNSIDSTNLPWENISLTSAALNEIPEYMNRMHAGIFFINPLFSKQASAPTKLGEFLGCGIPCLSNDNVGDMELILEKSNTGVVIKDFSDKEIQSGVHRLHSLILENNISNRCINTAEKHFSLQTGVSLYSKIYKILESIQ